MNWDDVRIFLAIARSGQILGAAQAAGAEPCHSRPAADGAGERPEGAAVHPPAFGHGTDPGGRGIPVGGRADGSGNAGRARRWSAMRRCRFPAPCALARRTGSAWRFLRRDWANSPGCIPDLNIELVPVPRSFSLSRREADIAITVERPEQGRLVASRLVDYRLGLYASKTYLSEAGTPQTVEELSQHRLVGYVEDLLASPSLAYAGEIHARFPAAFCRLFGAGSGRSRAFRRRHRHFAHVHCPQPQRDSFRVLPRNRNPPRLFHCVSREHALVAAHQYRGAVHSRAGRARTRQFCLNELQGCCWLKFCAPDSFDLR